MTETKPTFQELLTSQEARDKAERFSPQEGKGTYWMTPNGSLMTWESNQAFAGCAIWQGYLQEAAPPPEPRVFKQAAYFNVYDRRGLSPASWTSSKQAEVMALTDDDRIACVRVEITATEGQFDD